MIGRPAVCGGARLTYTAAETWVGTRLVAQWVRPPLHMTKVYHDRAWAISQLMSPTAGLLQDDVLEVDVQVEAGARVALISPAACRVHTMGSGHATVRQQYRVGAGAVLDVWPAPLILQKEASLRQETRLEVDPTATVLLCDLVSPGRAAFGECFEFTEWSSRLRIYRAGRLLSLENFSAQPARGDLADWRERYPAGSYAGLYYLSPEPLQELIQSMHDLETPGATIGASPLREGGLGLKLLAEDGISLRAAIFSVRKLLIQHSGIDFPHALTRAQTFFH
jgi:urease accessory protein